MNPSIADAQAVFAALRARLYLSNLAGVAAGGRHVLDSFVSFVPLW
jgi:hypothetical protein